MRRKRTKEAPLPAERAANGVSDRHPGPSVVGPLRRQWDYGSLGDCWSAGPEASVLVVGPPRSGKTSCLVIPNVSTLRPPSSRPRPSPTCSSHHVPALGARQLSSSSTRPGRSRSQSGAYPLRWSPVVGCDTFEQAVAMAHALALGGSAGLGVHRVGPLGRAGRGPAGATALRRQPGEVGTWLRVCRWVLGRDLREPLAALEDSGHEMAQSVLAGVVGDRRPRALGHLLDGLGPPRRLPLRGCLGHDAGPQLRSGPLSCARPTPSTSAPRRTPKSSWRPWSSPCSSRSAPPSTPGRPNAAPVVFALDEVASIAPLPSLPALAAEGGGQGLVTMACLQDLSQARARWGEVADGFFSLFNNKVIFPGIGDHRTLTLVSALAGEHQVQTQSLLLERNDNPFSGFRPRAKGLTYSTTWRPRLSVDEVARGRPGYALAVNGGTCPTPAWSAGSSTGSSAT